MFSKHHRFFAGVICSAWVLSAHAQMPGITGILVGATSNIIAIANPANSTDATSQTIYTETSVSFGTASADRCIIVAFTSRQNIAGRTVSSVTIGGISATNLATANLNQPGVPSTDIAAIYSAAVPTGTSGTIVITFSAAMLRLGYAVYAVTGVSSCAAFAANTNTAASGTSITNTLNVPANGGSISVVSYTGTATPSTTWTNTTKDFDSAVGGVAQAISSAHETTTAAQSSLVITSAYGITAANLAMATASFGP